MKSIQITKEAHEELIREIGIIQSKEGKKVTFSRMIEILIINYRR